MLPEWLRIRDALRIIFFHYRSRRPDAYIYMISPGKPFPKEWFDRRFHANRLLKREPARRTRPRVGHNGKGSRSRHRCPARGLAGTTRRSRGDFALAGYSAGSGDISDRRPPLNMVASGNPWSCQRRCPFSPGPVPHNDRDSRRGSRSRARNLEQRVVAHPAPPYTARAPSRHLFGRARSRRTNPRSPSAIGRHDRKT